MLLQRQKGLDQEAFVLEKRLCEDRPVKYSQMAYG